MLRSESLKEALSNGAPLLADGAMGTMIHEEGISLDACFDSLNLAQPDLVCGIHRAYARAGAGILESNSFGANRFKLAGFGLESKTAGINAAAVRLARAVAEESETPLLVAGSVGPLGVRLAPFGRIQPKQAYDAFYEQIEALVQAGVDLIFIETQSDLYEAEQAVRAARDIAAIPLLVSMTFTRDDRTLFGDSPRRAAHFLAKTGADVIGANCSSGPAQLLRILKQMREAAPEARFAVMPNAGWPEQVGGRIMYPATPEYFADYAVAYCEAGAVILGGCCGTTPAHIQAMRAALDRVDAPCIQDDPIFVENGAKETEPAALAPTGLAQKLAGNRFVISVEMDPPRGYSTHKLLVGAHMLAEAGADAINVADSPMARMRMSPWAVCELVQREVGIESILHFPTRGRNLLRVQGDLLAAHALMVRNVFVVMGDPTAIGDFPEAMDNYDVVPSGLIKLIKHGFNSGVDHAGGDIGEATQFFVGCALNLNPHDPEREIRLLKRKLEAGADFALTQPVYEPGLAREFIARYRALHGSLPVPILVGVLPLYSARHAAFLHNEVPGIEIPVSIQQRITNAGESAPGVGVQIAIELLQELQDVVQGVYIMPAFSRYDLAAEIIEAFHGRHGEKIP